ncbi:MAG: hypothetical protein ACYC0C_12315 [Devosia sp.]
MTEFTTTVTAFAIATLIATVAAFSIMALATPALADGWALAGCFGDGICL